MMEEDSEKSSLCDEGNLEDNSENDMVVVDPNNCDDRVSENEEDPPEMAAQTEAVTQVAQDAKWKQVFE